MKKSLLIVILLSVSACTNQQIDRGAEKSGNVIGRVSTGTIKLVGHATNKLGDIIGLEQPEDPQDEMEDRRWQLCVAHPCQFKDRCEMLYPEAFMTPSCKAEQKQEPKPRVFGPQRPALNPADSELYEIIKRQCPPQKDEISRWECIAEFFNIEDR